MLPIKEYLKSPSKIGVGLLSHYFTWLPDKIYLKLLFRLRMGYRLNLKNPRTFNEKLQWLKLYNRKPEYTLMVDKYEVKHYIADVIGKEYVIPTIGVWDTPNDIDWDALPNQFVLKTTHGGGSCGVVICKDKSAFDKSAAIRKLTAAMSLDIYRSFREWPYKDVVRRIIAEPYLEDSKTGELRDYKFFCMNGVCRGLFVATERMRQEEPYFDFFDNDFNHLDIRQGHPNSPKPIERPVSFELMKVLASKLSEGIPQVRVDFYEVNGKPYFGELTFSHFAGLVPFVPAKYDELLGNEVSLH